MNEVHSYSISLKSILVLEELYHFQFGVTNLELNCAIPRPMVLFQDFVVAEVFIWIAVMCGFFFPPPDSPLLFGL